MFKQYAQFRLKQPLPSETIPIGTIGVVLEILRDNPPAYEVEFPDGVGGNLGKAITHTISEEFMEPC